jgi:hypothetical protein
MIYFGYINKPIDCVEPVKKVNSVLGRLKDNGEKDRVKNDFTTEYYDDWTPSN